MNEQKNPHSGHRLRLLEKFSKNPDGLADHELLEIILFSALPRINTNGIAHDLLHTFGSLDKVFSASANELCAVKGIGLRAACEIMKYGEVHKRLLNSKKNNISFRNFSFSSNRQDIIDEFKGIPNEVLILYLLDKNKELITTIKFSSGFTFSVEADIPTISNAFAINKPKFVIMAHNHPSGILTASNEDDFTTAKINILCNTHGVELVDHVIVAKGMALSYFVSGRLAEIKKISSIDKLIGKLKENKNG